MAFPDPENPGAVLPIMLPGIEKWEEKVVVVEGEEKAEVVQQTKKRGGKRG